MLPRKLRPLGDWKRLLRLLPLASMFVFGAFVGTSITALVIFSRTQAHAGARKRKRARAHAHTHAASIFGRSPSTHGCPATACHRSQGMRVQSRVRTHACA